MAAGLAERGGFGSVEVSELRDVPYRLDDQMTPIRGGPIESVHVPDVDQVVFEQHPALSRVPKLMFFTDEAPDGLP